MSRVTAVALVCMSLLPLLAACGGGGPAPAAGPQQTLLSVTPDVGTTLGGTVITLKGTGFLDDIRRIQLIRFGEEIAFLWEIVDDTTIVVESPPNVVGETVINLVGANAPEEDGVLLARRFTYLAPTLYVAEGAAAAEPRLLRVDLDSGAVALVGPIGIPVSGMAMRDDGVLFAVEEGAPHRLLRIDRQTGAATPLALLRDAAGSAVDVRDLTFLDGRLLGRSAANALVEIDTDLGLVTTLDTLAGTLPGTALTVAGGDAVYLAPSLPTPGLVHHDVLTGVTSPGPPLLELAVLASLAARGSDLYAVSGAAPVDGMIDLLRIDPVSGAVDVAVSLPETVRAVARDA